MKVSQLIEALKLQDQDAEVIYWDEFGWIRAGAVSPMRVEPKPDAMNRHGGEFEEVIDGGVSAVAIEWTKE